MSDAQTTYRWNTSSAAEAYDAAAPAIHPFYETVQDELLDQIPIAQSLPFHAVDLGGGSGRLAERILERFPHAELALVDQSEPFLALAERRLRRFGPRARFVQRRLQEDWSRDLAQAPDVIFSTSAIHHLEPAEKRSLFARCFAALRSNGRFINGDEYRPAGDAEFKALLEEWSVHMHSALDEGRIPDSFRQTLEQWRERNLVRFGEPKKSGDDCQETVGTQIEYLREAGFAEVDVAWAKKLWAVVVAAKK